MSTERGNAKKKGQKYKNKTAFKLDKYGKNPHVKAVTSVVVAGVCVRCRDIIEWKKKYNKYKPLSAPAIWCDSFRFFLSFPYQLFTGLRHTRLQSQLW
eukprot:m.208376 g.208376  ORF g.208376 m.208376 type:complete len:98 (+) comp22075_c0_seq2:966-1259(+)